MTRELKLALIVGFSLVLIVTVLISDHLSKARRLSLEPPIADHPFAVPVTERVPAALEPSALATNSESTPPSEPAAPPAVQVADQPVQAPAFDPPVIDQHPPVKTAAAPVKPHTEQVALQTPIVERYHTVVEGDNLYQIAKKYYGSNSEWNKIAQANNIRPENLKLGMKLKLPGLAEDKSTYAVAFSPAPTSPAPGKGSKTESTKPEPAKSKTYTVKQGDTLASILRRTYGSTGRLSEVVRLNGIEDEDALSPGATLKLP